MCTEAHERTNTTHSLLGSSNSLFGQIWAYSCFPALFDEHLPLRSSPDPMDSRQSSHRLASYGRKNVVEGST